jgi:integrase
LRAREVGALTLDDIDWKRDHLHIRGRKAGRWGCGQFRFLQQLSRDVCCDL